MYAKIFSQIYDSSIADDWQVRIVFQDLLILSDSEGIVDMTQTAIAARTRLPLDIINHALKTLSQPDPRSRSKDEEGKRIVPIDPERGWGWRIVNYTRYRNIKSDVDRKAYMREYMRENRPSRAKVNKGLTDLLTSVNEVNRSASASVSVFGSKGEGVGGGNDASRPTVEEVLLWATKAGLAEWKAKDWFDEMEGCGWLDYNHRPIEKWQAVLSRVKTKWESDGRPSGPPGPNGNTSKGGVPLWQQIKSVEALLATEKERLSKLHVSDRNLYPEQYAEDLKKVTPVKTEIRRLSEMLTELHRKLTHEKTHD